MASKAVAVQDQPRVGGKLPDTRNRGVLRDIGNFVAPPAEEKKPQNNQISRPVTGFEAHLLANAQAAAAQKYNCKKSLAENVNELVAKEPCKKDPLKPKNAVEHQKERKVREGSLKIQNKTLTSILSARSKAACGVTKKPKDLIVDIDAKDVDNELAAVEYIEDMYNYYKLTEDDGRVHDYMDSQPEINSKMRGILVNWLIEVHNKFELMPESLYLTVNIVDRFLSVETVLRRELQLVGITAMLIACKYEEIWAPEVSDFLAISDNAYVREQMLVMEKSILGKLEWYLTVPTPYVFLVRYIKASLPADKEMENMTFFLMELGLTNYGVMIPYRPSELAAAAVYAARCTLGKHPVWTETLKHHTGYSKDQLRDCAKLLVSLHGQTKLNAVSGKYSSPERCAVALFPAARTTLLI